MPQKVPVLDRLFSDRLKLFWLLAVSLVDAGFVLFVISEGMLTSTIGRAPAFDFLLVFGAILLVGPLFWHMRYGPNMKKRS